MKEIQIIEEIQKLDISEKLVLYDAIRIINELIFVDTDDEKLLLELTKSLYLIQVKILKKEGYLFHDSHRDEWNKAPEYTREQTLWELLYRLSTIKVDGTYNDKWELMVAIIDVSDYFCNLEHRFDKEDVLIALQKSYQTNKKEA